MEVGAMQISRVGLCAAVAFLGCFGGLRNAFGLEKIFETIRPASVFEETLAVGGAEVTDSNLIACGIRLTATDDTWCFTPPMARTAYRFQIPKTPRFLEIRVFYKDRGAEHAPAAGYLWVRDRSVEENIDLFRRMRDGEFEDGEHVLRAKIDMASANMNMRDPTIYRIRHIPHQRTGDKWCIYPMYDFAHGLSDAFEGVTHSLCTLEFEDHRPLYDWFIDEVEPPHRPCQYEFSRLNLAYTLMSKRKLLQLVEDQIVSGWDDPRMPTLAGMRRRGYPPAALREFCRRVGVTKKENLIEMAALENCIRENLDHAAQRRMAVIRPLKVVLTNYPEGQTEQMPALNHPNRPELGSRDLPFTREIYIEQTDFMEEAPRKFFRLKPGGEVRLRYGYIICCDEVIKDESGQVVELRCSYDADTRSGTGSSDRKVKGTIHWVSTNDAVAAEVKLYDRLFTVPDPASADDVMEHLNPDSLEIVTAQVEPSLGQRGEDSSFQFERLGYFTVDTVDTTPESPVFNRIVTLRDSWAKIEKQALQQHT